MLVTRHSPHYNQPLPFPIPSSSLPSGNPPFRSISTPTITHLTATFNYKQPVQTGPPPFSRSSSIRHAAQDPASDEERNGSEVDELAGDGEDDEDGFLAHQTKLTVNESEATPSKRKGKLG